MGEQLLQEQEASGGRVHSRTFLTYCGTCMLVPAAKIKPSDTEGLRVEQA